MTIRLTIALVACLTLTSPPAAAAQDEVIEEIIVTAQKRAQSIQEVAASISALSAKDLDAKGIKDMYDIQFAVPSLHFGEMLGEQNISIRGIGAFARQPGVSVSIDGIYQSRSSTAQLYQLDLERVEVLRGPQGTLYGRNSNGGVVNFITASPTQEVEGFLRVGYAEYDEAKVQAVYSGPINDRVSFRVAVDHTDRGEGWIDNNVPGQDDLMQGDYTNARFKLAAEVTDAFSLDLMYAKGQMNGPLDHYVWITDNRELALGIPQLATAGFTLEPLETFVDTLSDSKRDYDLFSLAAEWDLGPVVLKSITAQQDFRDDFDTDRDATDLPVFRTEDVSNIETFTQEFNILGGNDTLEWVVGAFYLKEEWDRRTFFNNELPVLGFPVPSQLDFNQTKYETDSLSFFVDGTWNITDRARISAGLRRTKDEVDEFHVNNFNVLVPDPVLAFQACNQGVKEEWSATTARAVGQYDVTENGNVYLSYSEGYKAGGVAQYECTPAYDPEEVEAYELGYKATFADGRTSLSAAVFYYDYTDFQVTQVIGIATVTRNAGDAEVTGAELELSSLLNENWEISTGVTLLDTEYGDFINVDGIRPELGFQNLKGNPLNNAPETSVNLGVAYSTDVPWGGRVIVRVDAAYRSRTYFREFEESEDSQEGYTVVNVNATWESEDRSWEARLFAKNASDEEYITSILGSATGGGRFGTYGMPRQAGFEVTRRFGKR
ncbi:MAG: iron complex outermembrane receptor protein [Candidatus Azotimanducaceae bacterium]|jgi:iron complex outermembrane receptor protein